MGKGDRKIHGQYLESLMYLKSAKLPIQKKGNNKILSSNTASLSLVEEWIQKWNINTLAKNSLRLRDTLT